MPQGEIVHGPTGKDHLLHVADGALQELNAGHVAAQVT